MKVFGSLKSSNSYGFLDFAIYILVMFPDFCKINKEYRVFQISGAKVKGWNTPTRWSAGLFRLVWCHHSFVERQNLWKEVETVVEKGHWRVYHLPWGEFILLILYTLNRNLWRAIKKGHNWPVMYESCRSMRSTRNLWPRKNNLQVNKLRDTGFY